MPAYSFEALDAEGQQVTPARSFPYDTLIISVGSQSNDFGTPGVRENAMGMIVNGFIEPVTRTLPMEYAVEWSRLIELQMEGSVG